MRKFHVKSFSRLFAEKHSSLNAKRQVTFHYSSRHGICQSGTILVFFPGKSCVKVSGNFLLYDVSEQMLIETNWKGT